MCAIASLVVSLIAATVIQASASQLPPAAVLDRVAANERRVFAAIADHKPLLEIYIQESYSGSESLAQRDHYFLGRVIARDGLLRVARIDEGHPLVSRFLERIWNFLIYPNSMEYAPDGFAATTVLDEGNFKPSNYDISPAGREKLAGLDCLVFDLRPKANSGRGKFAGRIWLEDRGYHVVRLKGVFVRAPWLHYYFHFDTWRLNVAPNLWLPAYVFTEEEDLKFSFPRNHISFRAETRIWGYSTQLSADERQRGDTRTPPEDSHSNQGLATLSAHESQLFDDLQDVGLLAPVGDIDRVLNAISAHIEKSNKLPKRVRCRLLLTTPMSTVSIGDTVVISRGLLDVVPSEAALAGILAREIAFVLRKDQRGQSAAASGENELWAELKQKRGMQEERAADLDALELLRQTEYSEQRNQVAIFFSTFEKHRPRLVNLIRTRLGAGSPSDKYIGTIQGATPLPMGGAS